MSAPAEENLDSAGISDDGEPDVAALFARLKEEVRRSGAAPGLHAQGDASLPPQEKAPAGRGQPTEAPRGSGTPAPATEQAAHGDDNGGRPRSSPLARRLASERGLDLGQVRGSGPGGRYHDRIGNMSQVVEDALNRNGRVDGKP